LRVGATDHKRKDVTDNKEGALFNSPLKDLTIVGRDYEIDENAIGFVNTGERMVSWGKFGAFWGSIWGLLFGSAIIFVPGVGTVVLAGWLVTAIVGAVEGAALGGGIAAIGGALSSAGIAKDSVVRYEKSILAGKFLVIVRGSEAETQRAKSILKAHGGDGVTLSEHAPLVHA
jgi:hypothetical protein